MWCCEGVERDTFSLHFADVFLLCGTERRIGLNENRVESRGKWRLW